MSTLAQDALSGAFAPAAAPNLEVRGPVKKGLLYELAGGNIDSCLPEYTFVEASYDSDGLVKGH